MTFKEIVEARFACRHFDGRPVDEETLTKIFETANRAPSALNHQSQRLYVIRSPRGLELINSLCSCIRDSKTVLMIGYDKNDVWKNPYDEKIDSGMQDASIFATHVMLQAAELGVNSCWVNFFDAKKIKEAFGLPESEELVLIMPLGYAADDGGPNPIMHKKRKELYNLVHYL